MSEILFTKQEVNEILDLIDEVVYGYGVECNCGQDPQEYPPDGCFGSCTRANLLNLRQRLRVKRAQGAKDERQKRFEGATITPAFGPAYTVQEVISASNYGTDEKPDWYIEAYVKSPYVERLYIYWKQSVDGGTIEFREGDQ